MTRWFPAALVGALTLVPLSAAAQTTAPTGAQQPPSPSVNLFYVGANTGVTKVDRAGAVFGIEAGARVWKNLDLVGEYTWMHDIVTSDTLADASLVASSLNAATGQPAGSNVKVPAFYLGAGARWVFEQVNVSRFKPYVIFTLGAAHTDIQSTFTLSGNDVTNNLPQYGITLGQDLAGTSNSFGIDTGGGLVGALSAAWYADIGARLMSISTPEHHTNVFRFVVGGGYKF